MPLRSKRDRTKRKRAIQKAGGSVDPKKRIKSEPDSEPISKHVDRSAETRPLLDKKSATAPSRHFDDAPKQAPKKDVEDDLFAKGPEDAGPAKEAEKEEITGHEPTLPAVSLSPDTGEIKLMKQIQDKQVKDKESTQGEDISDDKIVERIKQMKREDEAEKKAAREQEQTVIEKPVAPAAEKVHEEPMHQDVVEHDEPEPKTAFAKPLYAGQETSQDEDMEFVVREKERELEQAEDFLPDEMEVLEPVIREQPEKQSWLGKWLGEIFMFVVGAATTVDLFLDKNVAEVIKVEYQSKEHLLIVGGFAAITFVLGLFHIAEKIRDDD